MTKLGSIEDVSWMSDLQEIVKTYLDALGQVLKFSPHKLKTMRKDLRKELEQVQKPVNIYSDLTVAQGVQFVNGKIGACGDPKCIIRAGVFGGIFKKLGSTASSDEANKAVAVIEYAMSTYENINSVYKLPQDLLDTLDGGITNLMKSGTIHSDGGKYIEKLLKWEKRFEKITDLKLYKQVGKLKKAVKTKALQPFRAVYQKLLKTSVGSKMAKFMGKITGKVSDWLAGGTAAGKIAGKVLGTAGKVASKFGFAVLDLGMAVWDIIDGIKKLKEGSSVAKQFLKAAEELEAAHHRSTEEYHLIVQ